MADHSTHGAGATDHSAADDKPQHDGFAGGLARRFVDSPLTPLLLLASFIIGLMGMVITPREEDPQISVPMVDIFVAYPGASAEQVKNLVAEPLERLMSEISGVKHVYSMSQDGRSMVTVRFDVGQQMEPSLVKLYDKLYSHMDAIPKGVMEPLVKPKGIDDVPVVTLTLSSKADDIVTLRKLAMDVQQKIKSLPNTGQSFIAGGSPEQVRVEVGHLPVGHTQRGAEIAAVQDLRGGIVDVEVAAGVEEVGRQHHELGAREVEEGALVVDALQAIHHQLVEAEVGDEAQPQLGGVGVGVGGHQPAVDGGDDVRVLVRQEQVAQLGVRAEQAERLRQHAVVDLVATRIEQHRVGAVDDQVLVGLHREATREVLEQHVLVVAGVEQVDRGHDVLLQRIRSMSSTARDMSRKMRPSLASLVVRVSSMVPDLALTITT